MRAVRYDRFNGIDDLYLADLPDPTPAHNEVIVKVVSAALNPGALPALHGATYVPGRDIAGVVTSTGRDVDEFTEGDEVLGHVQSWDAHAELAAVPADQLILKPELLSWDVAGCLWTTPMAGVGAWKAVAAGNGDLLVIAGASGGVGQVAAQYAVRAGADVIGLCSERQVPVLETLGVTPVLYGDGEHDRVLTAAASQPVTAFIDAVGQHYVDLALALGVPTDRIDTVVNYQAAKEKGVKARGTRDAGGLPAFRELAELAAAGDLTIRIGATYPLDEIQDAYRTLRGRRVEGRIVIHPHEVSRISSHRS